ncbi:MAG: response regulator [Leptonema illini]|jgi:DNA-binding response OmpR family regulator|uniref:Response regulator n=1 Tax=Leptonema illini TaxID=183 RepID=A0A833H2H5_9LEPT|nr:MAG: response regulator [Leptonema illini]
MQNIEKAEETILIVDDTPGNVQFLAALLDDEGYHVRVALTGSLALRSVEKSLPDLILLDIMMPDMDGFEILSRLRGIPGMEEIPVIFLTARIDRDDIVRGFEAGAVDYVQKPFHALELLARIRTHLSLLNRDRTIQRLYRKQADLLHLLTHDLSASLSGMDSMAMLAENDADLALEFTQISRAGFSRCFDVISIVRRLMELEYDRSMLALQETPLDAAIEEAVESLSCDLQKKQVSIEKDIQYDGIVRGERVTLAQTVLRNVLHNAIKFSPRGGRIRIASRVDEFAEISIQDFGAGIPEGRRSALFAIDRNISSPGTEQEPGSGYGLVLAARFTEACGGQIWIENPDTGGTIVHIRLQIP